MPKRIEPLEIVDNLADIPAFSDEAEEAAFWGTHRLSDTLLDRMQPLGADVTPPARATTSITLRVDPALLARIQTQARQHRMPYQRLLKQFLEERLQQVEAADQGVPHPS
ncbi:MAG: CopG family antitoxin [Chloroflexota bacterium]